MRSTAVLLLMLIEGVAGCGGSDSAPPAPSPSPSPAPPPPAPVQLAEFHDPDSTFSTPDVRDVQEQIVQFDVANNSLIWRPMGGVSRGIRSAATSWRKTNTFRSALGQRTASAAPYFTETASATICDIEVTGGQLDDLGDECEGAWGQLMHASSPKEGRR